MSCLRPHSTLSLALALVALPATARAQYGATGETDAPIAARNDEDPTASGTMLRLQGRPQAQQSFASALPELPGTQVRTSGGLGSFTALTLRGTSPGQTTVLLGNLPLSGPDTGAFDFSLLPVSAFESVEVYRGGAPAWFGNGAVGGVVRLLPRRDPVSGGGVSVAAGSFGSYQIDAHLTGVAGPVSIRSAAMVQGTAGDYPFWNDGGTWWDESDDFEDRVENGESLLASGLSHLRVETGRGELDVIVLGVSSERGVHGPYRHQAAMNAREQDDRIFASLGYTERGAIDASHGYELQLTGGLSYQRLRLDDRRAELGYGKQYTDDRILSAHGRLAARLDATSWLETTAVFSVRADRYDPENAFASVALPESERLGTAGTLEARAHGKIGEYPVELRPSLRLGWSRATTHGFELLGGGAQTYSEGGFAPTYRVGAAIGLLRWLSLSTSVYSGARLPSMLELFGNRGSVQPSPELRAEESTGLDAGLVTRGSTGALHGSAELRGYYQRVDELIRFVFRPATGTFKAQNIDAGTLAGIEAGLSGGYTEHLELRFALTYTHSVDETSGHALPFRTPLSTYARVEGHSGALGGRLDDLLVYLELDHQGETPIDLSGLQRLGAQTWLGLGVRALALSGRVSVALSISDLFDAGGQDLLGFPLPGRRLWAQLALHKDLF